tara:strand:- start:1850 stop:2101 length:252 start_codon:yes stop_codon:yes gene_type:complete
MPNRSVLVGNFADDVCRDQLGQTRSEKILSDTEVLFELAETPYSSKQIAKDEKHPSISNHIEGSLDRTAVKRLWPIPHACEHR